MHLHMTARTTYGYLVLKALATACLALALLPAWAQLNDVYVFGTVKDYNTSKKLDGVKVTVLKNGKEDAAVVTRANGKYEFYLEFGYDYTLDFSKPGLVGKNVTINTQGVPAENQEGGLGMNIDMTLFGDIPGIDYSLLNNPIGKSSYDPEQGTLAWDMEYTANMQSELRRLEKEYDEKKKREASADAAFDKLMDQGNAAMAAEDYRKAVKAFTDALGIKPDDPIATAKLSDARIKMEDLDRLERIANQYAELIKQADGQFNAKNYEQAKAKYAEALTIKEEEAYPKQRIKECDVQIAELAKQAEEERKRKELNDQYNAAVAAGDAAFKAVDLATARARFQEAAGLKPDEKYPPQQLAAIDRKQAELAAKEEEERRARELDEAYQAAIDAGDAAFGDAQYDRAKEKYNEALALKPKEKYPQNQLAAIVKALEELARKQEEERKAKELEQAYQTAITAADQAFQAAEYDQARKGYNEALVLKPKEKYPVDQLAAIDKAIDDRRKKEEEERRAQQLEADYQAAIGVADEAFANERFDEARKNYNVALGLKPAERYPADRIAAIDRTLEERARQAEQERLATERDAKYNSYIAQAENLYGKDKLVEAREQYNAALGVKPDEAYPKERIVEIGAKLERLAAEAEQRRRQEELDARYNTLIASADKKFKAKDHAEALKDYKDASGLKPDEQYPIDRIAEVEGLMDEAARAAAERERLEREQAEKGRQYAEYIAQADADLQAGAYGAASTAYRHAAEVKPDEKYPGKQLALIEKLVAQAEADSLRAADEATRQAQLEEEQRRKAEADSLAAAREAEERARAEAENAARQAAQEREQRYADAITMADAAFRNEAWQMAREGYNDALALKPDEQYPKDRLQAIEQAENRARTAEERAEQERLRAEADSLRAAQEAERALAEQEELARQQAALDAERAIEQRYQEAIGQADQALDEEAYDRARGLYAQALDIKPNETYPQTRLELIDRLVRERADREAAERERRLAEQEQVAMNSADTRKEQEAEEFMREAREREEAEKYQSIKQHAAMRDEALNEREELAEIRRQAAEEQQERYILYQQDMANASKATKAHRREQVVSDKQQWLEQQHQWQQRRSRQGKEAQTTFEDRMTDRRQQAISMSHEQANNTEYVNQRFADWASYMKQLQEEGRNRNEEAYREALSQEEMAEERIAEQRNRNEEGAMIVEERRNSNLASQQRTAQQAEQRQMEHRRFNDGVKPNAPRANTEYARNELASHYPQGVTEESFTQGNNIIIRRVLVQGNKVDEYRKVIAKWGTFYFKNGQSISEHIWSRSTE